MDGASDAAGNEGLDRALGPRSLTLAIRHEMDKLILSGSIRAGERLNEMQFAERFKVSRGPVREAFRGLVEAGLLEFIPNRGVFVRRVSLADAIECYEVRSGLFGLAGRLAAERIDDAALAELGRLVDAMDHAIASGDGPGYYTLNLELHDGILAAARNARLVATYRRLVKELHLVRALNLDNAEHIRASNTEHRAMVEALAARDPDRAFDAHFRHVLNAKDRVIELSEISGDCFENEIQSGSHPSRKHQGRKTP